MQIKQLVLVNKNIIYSCDYMHRFKICHAKYYRRNLSLKLTQDEHVSTQDYKKDKMFGKNLELVQQQYYGFSLKTGSLSLSDAFKQL